MLISSVAHSRQPWKVVVALLDYPEYSVILSLPLKAGQMLEICICLTLPSFPERL